MVVLRCLFHLGVVAQAIAASVGDIGVDEKCQRPRVFLHMGHCEGPKYFFLYYPIIATLRQGFEEQGASVGVLDESDHGQAWTHSQVLDAMDACNAVHSRPLLMSVAWVWGTSAAKQFLKNASSRGAYLVMYQSEFASTEEYQYIEGIHPVSLTAYGAAELWDFSYANVNHFRGHYQDSNITYRFMPPGYSIYLDTNISLPVEGRHLHSIGFLGSLTGRDPTFVNQVVEELASSSLTMNSTNSMWDFHSLSEWLAQFPVVLNVHREDRSMTGCTDCGLEWFRMSVLLSNKACVISTSSYTADEKRFNGMVRFVAPSQIPVAFSNVSGNITKCQSASYDLFKAQHSPARILQQSGFFKSWPFSPFRRTTIRHSTKRHPRWRDSGWYWQGRPLCLHLFGVVVCLIAAGVYKLRVVYQFPHWDVPSQVEDGGAHQGLSRALSDCEAWSPWSEAPLVTRAPF